MKRIVLVLALFGLLAGASSPSVAEAGYYRRPILRNTARVVGRAGVLYAWNRLYYSQMYIPRPPSFFGGYYGYRSW
jgi:hypothetical protein